jgi:hypothetical protein
LQDKQQAYSLATPPQPAYIEIFARKSKLNVGFPCHDRIFDPWPSIYWKHFYLALQLHFEGYKETNSKLWKKEREFNFERKITLEKLFTSY